MIDSRAARLRPGPPRAGRGAANRFNLRPRRWPRWMNRSNSAPDLPSEHATYLSRCLQLQICASAQFLLPQIQTYVRTTCYIILYLEYSSTVAAAFW
jgi:hypothetical protein